MIKTGTFTSVWDGDTEITTPAVLDTETGEVTAKAVEADDVDILDKEYFTDEDGNEYEVCPECHEYILVTSMEDGIGHDLDELKRCKNSDCDYSRFVR
jgi:hypothetical protein